MAGHVIAGCCLWSFVECATDNQLHIPCGGMSGANARGASRKRHPACVVDAAAAEDGYWAWWRQSVVISDVRRAAAADCQWRCHEACSGPPHPRFLYTISSRTERQCLLVHISQDPVIDLWCPTHQRSQIHGHTVNYWHGSWCSILCYVVLYNWYLTTSQTWSVLPGRTYTALSPLFVCLQLHRPSEHHQC